MRIASSNHRNVHYRAVGKRLAFAGLACIVVLASGCASRSSLGDVQSNRGEPLGRCPLGQSKVCSVGWPSRVGGGNRDKTCRCS